MSHFVAEHSRDYPVKGWWIIHHDWTDELVRAVSALIEFDGGPADAYLSGQGEYKDRTMVEWEFRQDYVLPAIEIEKGDRLRLWLQRDPGDE